MLINACIMLINARIMLINAHYAYKCAHYAYKCAHYAYKCAHARKRKYLRARASTLQEKQKTSSRSAFGSAQPSSARLGTHSTPVSTEIWWQHFWFSTFFIFYIFDFQPVRFSTFSQSILTTFLMSRQWCDSFVYILIFQKKYYFQKHKNMFCELNSCSQSILTTFLMYRQWSDSFV